MKQRGGHQETTADNRQRDGSIDRDADNQNRGTLLARLCRYYLACMSWEDSSLSILQSRVGSSYAELPQQARHADIPPHGAGRELLDLWRRQGRKLEPVLGAPLLLRKAGRRWSIEPLILCRLITDEDSEPIGPDTDSMTLNPRAVQFLSRCGQDAAQSTVATLREELGLDETSLDFEETVCLLRNIRASWNWINEEPTNSDPKPVPLETLTQIGVYDRTVLALRERTDYTLGLAAELNELSELTDGDIDGTALGGWLTAVFSVEPDTGPEPLLDALPQNAEQRGAIEASSRNGLTVVTGPPGTGKSQLVSGLLVNAAWRGDRVLLASKNNRAVDVVEARVNGLANQPVLLRAGSGIYRQRLAATLVGILNAPPTSADRGRYETNRTALRNLAARIDELDSEIAARIESRNRLDRLEQEAERGRPHAAGIESGPQDQSVIRKAEATSTDLLRYLERLEQRPPSGFLGWIVGYPLYRYRSGRAQRRVRRLDRTVQSLGIHALQDVTDATPGARRKHVGVIRDLLTGMRRWFDYRNALAASHMARLDDIHRQRLELDREYRTLSREAWLSWVATRPARMHAHVRQAIARQRSALELAAGGGEMSGHAYAAFRKATETAVSHLGLWGCTALSARRTLPLKPGVFDLVVIDEASQCDIASVLPLLYRAKRAMIIGDPNQLSHISRLSKAADLAALERHGLQPDFTHWSYRAGSLFDLASALAAPEARISLVEHHRSHPDIIGFSDSVFYGGRLRVVTQRRRLEMPRTRFQTAHLTWVDCQGMVTQSEEGGAENQPEAERVVRALTRLIGSSQYRGSVGVVTPFRQQANLIRHLAENDRDLIKSVNERKIVVDTVHRFQGDERDVMIFSPVLSKNMPDTARRFLMDTPNLFNVAVTRARAMLVVIGDRAAFRGSSGHLKAFEDYVDRLQTAAREISGASNSGAPDRTGTRSLSPWVRVLYRALREAGLDPRYQVRVETEILDLVLVRGDRKLDIEVDTAFHRRNWSPEDGHRFRLRDARLFELGWDVRRFWVSQVRDSLPQCVAGIMEWDGLRDTD